MTRTAFIFLLLVYVADMEPAWLLWRRPLLSQVSGQIIVASSPNDVSKNPLAISDATAQSSEFQHHHTPDHSTRAVRRRLYRRTQLEPKFILPVEAEFTENQPTTTTTTSMSTSTDTSTSLSGTTTSTLTASSTPTTLPTATPDAGLNVFSNVLQVPILPSPPPFFPSSGDNPSGDLQNNQLQYPPQPNVAPPPENLNTQDAPSPPRSPTTSEASAMSPPSLVILSIAIVAVMSLVVLGSAVVIQRRRNRRARVARMDHIEGGHGSIASYAHPGRRKGEQSWRRWFSRRRKDSHYGLHSFNSSGSNSLPEQFWNPE
ncbi:hypothetical protein BGW42_007029 [Actinomortierella wolfii]|nr:hypothetical protein BGW42_007029 [Actinomortierella wolfii]